MEKIICFPPIFHDIIDDQYYSCTSIYTNSHHPSKHKARLHFLLIFSMHTQMFLSITTFIYFSLAFVFLTLQKLIKH